MIYTEPLTAGRMASSEAFDFDVSFLRTRIFDKAEKLILTDTMNLEPTKKKNDVLFLFGSKNILFTAYVMTREENGLHFENEINTALNKKSKKMLSGLSLPNGCGYVVKILSDSVDDVNMIRGYLLEMFRKRYLLGA